MAKNVQGCMSVTLQGRPVVIPTIATTANALSVLTTRTAARSTGCPRGVRECRRAPGSCTRRGSRTANGVGSSIAQTHSETRTND